MSSTPASKKNMLPSLMTFLNWRDSINLKRKSEIIEYSTIVNNLKEQSSDSRYFSESFVKTKSDIIQ